MMSPVASAQPLPGEDAEDHERHPERADGREALVEDQEREDGYERYPQPPSDGVDDGEVPRAVGAAEGEDVGRVQDDGGDHERQRRPREPRLPEDVEDTRQVEQGPDAPGAPEEGEGVARPLGERVPASMDQGGGHHEAEGGGTHRDRVRASPSPDKSVDGSVASVLTASAPPL